MVDKKAERLINLTLALLATKRYLKKSEIFSMVSGYSGSAESMDRMFERDKNELRNLGIDISVGDLDPLFDDEPGYRIFKDSYGFQLKGLEPADVAILSVAAKLWNDAVLGVEAQSGLLKIESLEQNLHLENEVQEPLIFGYRYEDPTSNLIVIEEAIFEGRSVKFSYRDGSSTREVEPYRIFLWRGFWYFIGRDVAKNEIRSFKISRISGELEKAKSKFKIPSDFNVIQHLPEEDNFEVIAEIEEGKGVVLRNHGIVEGSNQGNDLVRLSFADFDTALKEFLRHGGTARIIEPEILRKALITRLEELADV